MATSWWHSNDLFVCELHAAAMWLVTTGLDALFSHHLSTLTFNIQQLALRQTSIYVTSIFVMLRNVASICIMLRYVTSICIMLCYVTSICIMLRYVTSICIMLCYVASICIILRYVASICIMLLYATSICIMLLYVAFMPWYGLFLRNILYTDLHWILPLWTLLLSSITHYDITIGYDIASDVHC